jgi:3-oxoacyl-[acyl-carrier-protein] synthase-3
VTRGCSIAGCGTALPPTVVRNADLEILLDTSDEWISERSGIRTRRTATGPFVPGDVEVPIRGCGTTAKLALVSARQACESAGISTEEIDLLILCTTTPDRWVPATSAAVAGALGIHGGAMDLNSACAGFTYGLITAAALISLGTGRVLVVGAETMSRITNWQDRTNAFLFGDGAGAVVLEPVEGEGSLLGWHIGVNGSLTEILYADHGHGIVMKGKEVFRQAVRVVTDSAKMAVDHAGVEPAEIALFVPHQANRRIMESAADRLNIPMSRVASVIEWSGNTSSASIPLALADAAERARLHRGDLILLSGFGAGMTWASSVWRWDRDT